MKRTKLKVGNIIIFSLVCLALAAGVIYYAYKYNFIPHKMYTNEDFGIETYVSSTDKDGDGIDDQTDILQNVRAYIATEPKYMSRYYDTGYPNDEYGVCTDVVAQGLLGAGYDLMELVYEDRCANPNDYADEPIDKNIDFRRVRNLLAYFRNTAIELTCDVHDIEQWQGGDIVVFEGHIGIVSAKRNKNGVCVVIHNGSPMQHGYEQGILENRNDIAAHFRIS